MVDHILRTEGRATTGAVGILRALSAMAENAITDLAGASEEWRECRMEIDGEVFDAYEREFEGQWVRYCLTPTLIVFVTGPTVLRPDAVILEELAPDELERV